MSDNDRPRKSWKEIDRQRDQGGGRRDNRGPGSGKRGNKSYKAALDQLFDSGKIADLVEMKAPGTEKVGGNRLKMLAKIRDAVDRDSVTQAIDEYMKLHEIPDDIEMLGRMLEHRNPSWQLEAMERIYGLLDQGRPKRIRAMLGQLRMIRDIEDDAEMVELSKKLIEKLE